MAHSNRKFAPDYAIPPGETLAEILESIGMTQAELAERTGRHKKTINEIIKGEAPITSETALQFELALNIPASFWMNLECNFQERKARLEEEARMQREIDWLKNIPVRAMEKKGWIKHRKEKREKLREVLSFFGVVSPGQWKELWSDKLQVAYRRSDTFESDPYATSAWLRQGQMLAGTIECEPYDAEKFKAILMEIRALTKEPPEIFEPSLKEKCASCGVAVVFLPLLPKCRVSGATRWLSKEKALIQLSLRYKTNDQLWFSLFHEAGHILKHGKKEMFLHGKADFAGKEEDEANRFAENLLIPASELRAFLASGDVTKERIIDFAEMSGIAPGIVVGRLQKMKVLDWRWLNDLKVHYEWKN